MTGVMLPLRLVTMRIAVQHPTHQHEAASCDCCACSSKKHNKISDGGAASPPPAQAPKPTATQDPVAQPAPAAQPIPAAAPAPATQPAATTPPSTMATCKIAVLYYSTYGHIAQVSIDLLAGGHSSCLPKRRMALCDVRAAAGALADHLV